jgi:hypothetical protein
VLHVIVYINQLVRKKSFQEGASFEISTNEGSPTTIVYASL